VKRPTDLRPLFFRNVAQQTLVVDYRCFGTTLVPASRLKQFAKNSSWTASASKKGRICYPKTSATIYEHSSRNVPEGRRPQLRRKPEI
jgi:hypothetical protein